MLDLVLSSLVAFLRLGEHVHPFDRAPDVAELENILSYLVIPHPNGFPLCLLLGTLGSFVPPGSLA